MQNNKYKGSTLVELVLYLALFSMIILTMVQFFVFVTNKNVDARNRIELSRSVIFLRQHFQQTEEQLTGFIDSQSTYNNDSGKIAASTQTGNITYTLSNSKVIFNKGSDIPLTPDGVVVSKLRFTKNTDAQGNTIGAKVSVTMTHVNVVNYSESFDFLIQNK